MNKRTVFEKTSVLFLSIYACAVALSIVIAHVLVIWTPQSGAAKRIVFPVTSGIQFVDEHWKATLILLAIPFVAPYAKDLITRIKKFKDLEMFEPVQVESEGVREKPPAAENK